MYRLLIMFLIWVRNYVEWIHYNWECDYIASACFLEPRNCAGSGNPQGKHYMTLSLDSGMRRMTSKLTIITIEMSFEFIRSEPNRSKIVTRLMWCSSVHISNSSRISKQFWIFDRSHIFLFAQFVLFTMPLSKSSMWL